MFFVNRKLVRGAACFFLLEFVATLAAPSVSWAMMGPGQPEFTSYETNASPDLVNLTTGDFTYNIPAIEVPGPERSFALPLTYRAGIKLEEEASWVGLGWSLNAGAIARSLTGYPDDAEGQLMRSTYNQQLTRGWEGGLPGILELGWDVNTGHHGSASLLGLIGLGWSGGGISSGSLVGITMDKNGITADPIAMVGAAITIATLGTAGPLVAVGQEALKQIGTDVAIGVATSVLLGRASSGGGALGEPTVKEEKEFLYTNYWVFYNDEKSEFMYGSLNFRDMSKRVKLQTDVQNPSPFVYRGSSLSPGIKSPEFDTYSRSTSDGTFESSPGADLYMYNAPGANYWRTNSEPISIAHDEFSVMGGSVSGSIRPYLLEVGSLAFPYRGLDQHKRFATLPYLNDYKVPFRYENSISNTYTYHQFTPSSSTTLSASGIDGYIQPTYSSSWTGGIVLKDPSFYDIFNNSSTRTERPRRGMVNDAGVLGGQDLRRLVQGKNVKWFSNKEITDLYASSPDGPGDGSFLEFTHPTAGYAADPPQLQGYTTCPTSIPFFTSSCQPVPVYSSPTSSWHNNPWRVTLPGKGVGAFAITAEDGTTYHYSLPVYHYTQYSTAYQKVAPVGVEKPGVSSQTIGPRNWDKLGGGFATTWLLTAITSSDYVDRGSVGTVDDADWGGWVRFDYGKFSSAYKWRQPYLGESYSENSYNDASFSEGYKETYYLNSIRTRTHTALFLKSVRNDARAHYQPGGGGSNLGIGESQPASALRLDEVVLLTNADLARLRTENGIRATDDTGPVVPALSENTAGNDTQYDAAELRRDDTYRNVLDKHDVDADARIRAFINQKALKRVVFNYSYRLCANTPNSFASATAPPTMDETQFACNRTGKLTLESLSTYGPADTRLIPDFKFQYGFNPDYQKNNWDGFGMYKSGVSVNTNQAPKISHQVSTDYASASRDASAWSLTEIISPLGGRTRIKYERDQYAKVSEFPLGGVSLTNNDNSNIFAAGNLPPGTTLADFVKPGDVLNGDGLFGYSYSCNFVGDAGNTTPEPYTNTTDCSQSVSGPFHVVDVGGNTLTIDPQDIVGVGPTCQAPTDYNCGGVGPTGASLNTLAFPANKNGGDLRVAAISTLDEMGSEYQVRYDYTSKGPVAGNSSGVISKEPVYVDRIPRVFDGWFDYPGTSVMYGKVAVVRGFFRGNNAADYSAREEYAFQTPVSSAITTTKQENFAHIAVGDNPNQFSKGYRDMDAYANNTTINLGMIGQPLSIKKVNRRGEVESSTSFEYGNDIPNADRIPNQGNFTEGVLTNELLGPGLIYYRINRSTKTYKPTLLVATTTTAGGISTRSKQEKFDFYTGQVLESSFKNFLGDVYHSKVVPAYTLPIYAAMGPASEDRTNRNMLSQEAASYVYKVRPNGAEAVVSAGIQTWEGSWNTYRTYNSGTDSYQDEANDVRPVWRLHESYAWISPRLNADGTYSDADFTAFNWASQSLANQGTGWVKAGEFTRYDHYSKPLESRDINGQYVARKLGYNQTQRLITAANARYTELVYSGAEDLFDQAVNSRHFGGEVRGGDKRSAEQQHTGAYSLKLQAGETGFTYQAAVGSEVRGGQKYRLSCWVHQSDATSRQAQLYAQVDGTDLGVATIASANTKQAGNWYLLNLIIDMPASGQRLTIGCRHAGGGGAAPVYLDDFRFHPLLAPATAYVYDPQSSQLTYVLDNDNLFTHYEYDASGKVKRVSKEALTTPGNNQSAERRLKEYEYNFARATESNWLPTGVVTWDQGATGQITMRRREERDINPLSSSYNTTRMVEEGTSPRCGKDCPPYGLIVEANLCGESETQAGEPIYFTYNLVTDGNCSTTVLITGPLFEPCP